MTRDEIYDFYDRDIPEIIRNRLRFGYGDYNVAYNNSVNRQRQKRCLEIVQSICAWRDITRYTQEIKEMMLARLSGALLQARDSALVAWRGASESTG